MCKLKFNTEPPLAIWNENNLFKQNPNSKRLKSEKETNQEQKITILVKEFSQENDGKFHMLFCNVRDNVRELKLIIQKELGIPFKEQRLILNSKDLRNFQILGDHKPKHQNEVIIHMLMEPKEEVQSTTSQPLFVKCLT